ncbi:MAG: hypothetical protein F6J98_08585 [Moorea sp. SIO4G2]|uniref:hypothetical protein n=1 Tax=Moorena TaxID=1155738 RepID=UPI0013018C74|nr:MULTISPECIES: hypothetical protein [Moorena]NEO11850.1 hypothetical protein [Moorena sp. SIO3E8]NEO50209.1 hypothetical protein [Moorena sp. SIO4A3]NEO60480.1 hypothetical protein [Moorena sp. SIO4G2]NEP98768.1 hypothetical protein [Moorena sp. SIO3F7]
MTVSIQLSAPQVSAHGHATPNSQRPVATLHGTVYAHSARCQPCKARVGETTAVAHGGNPQDRAASP